MSQRVSGVWDWSRFVMACRCACVCVLHCVQVHVFTGDTRGAGTDASECCTHCEALAAMLAVLKWTIIPLLAKSNIRGVQIGTPLCHDFYPVSLICILGLTNGFCASCCMMHWSKVLKDPRNENVGATLMIFSITIGLITGSLLSYVVVQVVIFGI